ncbi:hypothetical protein [Shewanella waksmanii]|uniref:hypothetical protein n=1 Tax=Shewanella waksmanii TaxID=213783 RepID=UPI003735414C
MWCRIEPGCLGPNGAELVESFCKHAYEELKLFHPKLVNWIPLPRYDKSLPEFEYRVLDKKISRQQAIKLVEVLGGDLSDLEDLFNDKITELIFVFLAHHGR